MARSSSSLTVRDTGWNKILDNVSKSNGTRLSVGVVGQKAREQHTDSNLTVAVIAAIHEFGTAKIPERSFLRSTLNENEARYRGMINLAAQSIAFDGINAQNAMAHVGELITNDIKQKIRNGIEPANADSTLKQKQGDTPLIDTEQLIKAIGFVVTRELRNALGQFEKPKKTRSKKR